jgi:hypothetical protein
MATNIQDRTRRAWRSLGLALLVVLGAAIAIARLVTAIIF